jgi:hypothetical protein
MTVRHFGAQPSMVVFNMRWVSSVVCAVAPMPIATFCMRNALPTTFGKLKKIRVITPPVLITAKAATF